MQQIYNGRLDWVVFDMIRDESIIIYHQVVLVLVVALISAVLLSGFEASKAILFGGVVSIIASLVMACRLSQAIKKSQRGSLYIYLGAIERILISLTLFGIGLMWLKLSATYTVVGLIAGQIGFMIGGFRVKE